MRIARQFIFQHLQSISQMCRCKKGRKLLAQYILIEHTSSISDHAVCPCTPMRIGMPCQVRPVKNLVRRSLPVQQVISAVQ